jgi:hypothetical protein
MKSRNLHGKFALKLTGALAAVLLAGCSTSLLDARRTGENADICEIHHTYMETTRISSRELGDPPGQEYLAARVHLFIHSYPVTLPRRARTTYVIYLCDECVRAEAAWQAQHKSPQH